jgi:hypothetical protein
MLKAILTKEQYEALHESVKEYYKEVGEKYFLQVTATEGHELADTGGLKSALEKERASSQKSSKELRALKEAFKDLDPDAAREALAKVAEMADWDPENKLKEAKTAYEKQMTEKFEVDRTKLVAKHDKERTDQVTEIEKITGQLTSVLIDSEATKAITTAKGSIDLLSPIVKSSVRLVVDDNGTRRVSVVGSDGTERLSTVSGSTQPMTIAELVEELKLNEKFAPAFDGTGATGSGASSSGSRSAGTHRITNEEASNIDVYKAKKAAAEKAGKTLELTE